MAAGKDFGPFELHQKIGSGGMASVYLGTQKSLGRKVVLKVLYPHLAEDAQLVARFEREARAAAMLRHENVVQIIDCGRHEDVAYIAMEFIDGMDLKRWLEAHETPPVEMSLLILRDVCRGLEHAHEHRIVHRDIKPGNLMLTPEGVTKIMDFGLARRSEDTTTVTVVGSVLGTPAYMSPEQATGETVDERSDVFSVGVVAYELLGGRRPFGGDSYSSVLRSILTVDATPLADFNPLVPEEVTRIVHRMLQKDVSKRYQSVGQARGDLDAVLDQMGLHRGRDLLREYVGDPESVARVLRGKRLARHLDQGLYFEKMGMGKIDDALLEFRRALFLDPENATAREHLSKLERELEKMKAGQEGDVRTVVLPPDSLPGATGTGAPPAPAAPPHTPATPEPGTVDDDRTVLHTPVPATPGVAPVKPPAPKKSPAPAPAAVQKPDAAPKPAAAPRPARPRAASSTRQRQVLFGAVAALIVLVVFAGAMIVSRVGGGPGGGPGSDGPGDDTPVAAGALAALEVTSTPAEAVVWIDGERQSAPSGSIFDSLAVGQHVVRVEHEGFAPQEKTVRVEPGPGNRLTFELEALEAPMTSPKPAPAPGPPATGTLDIRVAPFASYYVDGELKASNVATARIRVPEGTHTVRAVHPAFEPKVWTGVRVRGARTTTLRHDFLTASPGRIRVTSGGVWAKVYLDGKDTGKTTPCVLEGVSSGQHVVRVERAGFSAASGGKQILVKPGEDAYVGFELHPVK